MSAERAVSRVLGGSCRVPLAAYCVPTPDGGLHLRANIASLDGATLLEADARSAITDLSGADALGVEVARSLLAQGAQAFVPEAGR